MKESIKDRVIETAMYIIDTGATVRATASKFDISKSTVHSDVTTRLANIDAALYENVCKVLCINKSERHIRGGEKTRQKYQIMRELGK